MGFRKRRGNKAGDGTKSTFKQDNAGPSGAPQGYEEHDRTNANFERYYKAQNLIPEEQWPVFMDALRRSLPVTFRFTGSRVTAQDLNEHLIQHYVPYCAKVEIDGVVQPPPTQLPWYPDGLGWQIKVGKMIVRKSAEYKKLQQFLVYETEVGNLSRQEAVSMIPPLLLDIKPHHNVLDMCAAPGSKTAQLLEAVNSTPNATGVVVANDSDLKRAQLLVHQIARLPSAGVMVTNLDASRYPKISLGPKGMETFGAKTLEFDRILCDVPCSGDGTMRKNPAIWKKWSPGDGNGLHNLQLRILLRAMDLLKPGGRLVFSTCSFNPIENEAVVAAAITANPAFSIVDVSDQLPHLIRSPGVSTWTPSVGKEGALYPTYEDFLRDPASNEEMQSKVHKTLWSAENYKTLGLEKCLRLYPQDQDTGGFFVTVLEKSLTPVAKPEPAPVVAPAPQEAQPTPEPTIVPVVDSIASTEPGHQGAPTGEPTESAALPASSLKRSPSPAGAASPSRPPAKKSRSTPAPAKTDAHVNLNEIKLHAKPDPSFKESPYTYLSSETDEVKTCADFFGLDSQGLNTSNFYVRNGEGDAVRSVYYTTPIVKAMIQSNEYTRLRLVSAGVKLFARQANEKGQVCTWRACAEGLPILLPFVRDDKILRGTMADLKIFLSNHYPLLEQFEEPTRTTFQNAPIGSLIFEVQASESAGGSMKHNLTVPIWRARNSMSLMIAKADKSALSQRTWGEDLILLAPPKKVGGGFPSVADNEALVKDDQDEAEEKKAEDMLVLEEEEGKDKVEDVLQAAAAE